MHGQGTYIEATGNKYVGEWKASRWHGKGALTYANGKKEVGEYKNGLPFSVVYFDSSGKVTGILCKGSYADPDKEC